MEASLTESTQTSKAWEQVQKKIEEGTVNPFKPSVLTMELSKLETKALNQFFDTDHKGVYGKVTSNDFEVEKYELVDGKEVLNDELTKAYTKIKNIAFAYVKSMKDEDMIGTGLYLHSHRAGSGKTLLACIIANGVAKMHNMSSQIFTMSYFLQQLQRSFNDSRVSEKQLWMAVEHTPLLIIDELAFEGSDRNGWKEEQVFNLVDIRYRSGKPVIITSNTELHSLPYHERVASRIRQITINIPFPDYDHREDNGMKKEELLLSKFKDK